MPIQIRSERPEDAPLIDAVIRDAFSGGEFEARLVELVRERDKTVVSLVAVDREVEPEQILGHVLLTPIELLPDAGLTCLGVAPVSVASAHQRRGIGSALMRAAIGAARGLGVDALFLLGDPAYYRRFGFAGAPVRNEYGAAESFQSLELSPACLRGIDALARYIPEFVEAEP